LFRIAEGVERDQKVAAKVEKEKEMKRKMKEEEKEMERRAKEAEDIMLGRKTKEIITVLILTFLTYHGIFYKDIMLGRKTKETITVLIQRNLFVVLLYFHRQGNI
jgi:ABC-type Fe3+-citrate transport system substrate-binding protein